MKRNARNGGFTSKICKNVTCQFTTSDLIYLSVNQSKISSQIMWLIQTLEATKPWKVMELSFAIADSKSISGHSNYIKGSGVMGFALRSKSSDPGIQRHGGTQPAGQAKFSRCYQKDRCKVEHINVTFLENALPLNVLGFCSSWRSCPFLSAK